MIYVKGSLPNGDVVIVPIKPDGLYCLCPVCKQETTVEYDIFVSIIEEGSLEESEQFCDTCSDDYRNKKGSKLSRIK